MAHMDPTTDTRLPVSIPSPIEIGGLVAVAVPFIVHASSMSSTTVNGKITSFVYRDPVAIACGIAAIAAGLFALLLLRRTEPARRALRVVLCVALVGGGTFQVLRGFGIVGVEKPSSSISETHMTFTPPTTTTAPPPVVVEKMPADIKAAAIEIATTLQKHDIDALFARSNPTDRTFDKFDLQYVDETYVESFGTLDGLGEPTALDPDGDDFRVEVPLKYAGGTLSLALRLVRDGKDVHWRGFDLKIPKDLQKPGEDSDGDAFARTALDKFLANEIPTKMFHPRLVDRTPADLPKKLAAVVAEFGAIRKIGDPTPRECEAAHCRTFAITGKKKKGRFEIELGYSARVWRIISWNLVSE